MVATITPLQEISPDIIRSNPDNPRMVFREDEMNELLDSIRRVGIKVPLSLYPERNHFTLIDGERRWRCARKLNLKTVPAIVQPKPSRLENILMMFNIHNVRVDWDLMPMAKKLAEVQELLAVEGRPTTAKDLAGVTAVPLATVRRALELLTLPAKYQQMLVDEATKPRSLQRIKSDLFIEIYKSLHACERHVPEVFEEVSKTKYVDALVRKYLDEVIDNVVAYRDISKMARAELADADKEHAVRAIVRLVNDKEYTIAQAYADTVESAYDLRSLDTRLGGIISQLERFRTSRSLTEEVRNKLERLREQIDRLLQR
jgi:ParB family transcriptional regulator, chromosome partitioning protein